MPQIQGSANNLCIRRSLTQTLSLEAFGTTSNHVRIHEQRGKRDTCGMSMMENRPAAYIALTKRDGVVAGGEGRRLAVSLSLPEGTS